MEGVALAVVLEDVGEGVADAVLGDGGLTGDER